MSKLPKQKKRPVDFIGGKQMKVRVVKFGGACLTNKQKHQSLNESNFAWFYDHVKKMNEQASEFKTVIIHGAGSFGHFEAKEYKITQGIQPNVNFQKGFCLTRASVQKLNLHIVEELNRIGVPAVAVSPFSYIAKNDISPAQVQPFVKQIEQIIEWDMIPVIHGDAVFTEPWSGSEAPQQNISILSGDTLMEILCRYFKPSIACFVTDVSGVYNSYPPPPHAKHEGLLSNIYINQKTGDIERSDEFNSSGKQESATATSNSSIDSSYYEQQKCDVTGGLKQKLDSCIRIVCNGDAESVYIVGCGDESASHCLLNGRLEASMPGTRIALSEAES